MGHLSYFRLNYYHCNIRATQAVNTRTAYQRGLAGDWSKRIYRVGADPQLLAKSVKKMSRSTRFIRCLSTFLKMCSDCEGKTNHPGLLKNLIWAIQRQFTY